MATTEFKVFHGVGAVITHVTSHTELSVLAITSQDPVDFSATGRFFKVDLKATPCTATVWSEVKFDDRGVDKKDQELRPLDVISLSPGITTLGGSRRYVDLMRGRFVGAVYIEHDHYTSIYGTAIATPGNPSPWPGSYYELYQVTSVAYAPSGNDRRLGKRYHGFFGAVKGVMGRLIQVEFPQPDGSKLGPWWFNLDAADECDSDPPPAALAGGRSIAVDPIAGQTEGAFFIALPHAAALDLSGPKLPIGLEDLRFAADRPATPSVLAPVTKHVNVSVVSKDRVLEETLEKIDGEARVNSVTGPGGVEGVFKEARGSATPSSSAWTLDLIAHAKNGILHFGEWVIDAQEQDSSRLRDLWGPLKPDAIRLLGCNTAATEPGRAAIRHLAHIFKRRVYGATAPLYARDFDANGLTAQAEAILAANSENFALAEDRISDATVECWFQRFDRIVGMKSESMFERLRSETLDEATRDVRLMGPLSTWPLRSFAADDLKLLVPELADEVRVAPGLLALPDVEALFPVPSSSGASLFYRVTILLGGRFVRIYPISFPDGVILRTKRILHLDGGIPVPLPT